MHNSFFMYVYFYSLHVSGSHVPIIRRINCINTTSGICHSADSLLAGSVCAILILLASCQANLYDKYHCCVYSEKLLMMDRGTVRNM